MDIYKNKEIRELLENDVIDEIEEGFMLGYIES